MMFCILFWSKCIWYRNPHRREPVARTQQLSAGAALSRRSNRGQVRLSQCRRAGYWHQKHRGSGCRSTSYNERLSQNVLGAEAEKPCSARGWGRPSRRGTAAATTRAKEPLTEHVLSSSYSVNRPRNSLMVKESIHLFAENTR